MSNKCKAVVAGSVGTAILLFLVYALLAGIACITSWSNDYWNLANWDEVSRFFLALLWFGAFLAGSISTIELVSEEER